MITQNFLKKKIESGQLVLGSFSIIPDPTVAEIAASAGLDFLVIDREHGAVSLETAQDIARACETHGVSPLLRIHRPDQTLVQQALDIGVHGIQVPTITSARQARDVLRFAKYPPVGERGFSPFTRAGSYGAGNAGVIVSNANKNGLIVVHIENKEGVDNIDGILNTEGIDVVFVGLYDLSVSLGFPGETEHPKVQQTLVTLVQKINAAGKYAGSIVVDPQKLPALIDIGVRYITYSVDCEVLRRGYVAMRNQLDKLVAGNVI